jgi:hypothetical protein
MNTVCHKSTKTQELEFLGAACAPAETLLPPKRGCQNSEKHVGPFFTITTEATEFGEGTRIPGKKRIRARQVVAHFCADCLLSARIVLDGKALLPNEAGTQL